MFTLNSSNFAAHQSALLLAGAATIGLHIAQQETLAQCNMNMCGMSIATLVDGSVVLGGEQIQEGQAISYRVMLAVPPPFGQSTFCDIAGGQLSVTLPNGHVVEVAGFPGTPEIPLFGDGLPFFIDVPITYVASASHLSSGVLIARADYGATGVMPDQENGTYQAYPPQQTANAVSSQWNELAPACPGDIAGDTPGLGHDGTVDIDDLLIVIGAWGTIGSPGIAGDIAPSNGGNGVVDVDDLLVIISSWGDCA